MEKGIEKTIYGPSINSSTFGLSMALIVISATLFFFEVVTIIPIVLFIIGLLFMLTFRIVEIDYLNAKIRSVLYIFPVKIGTWKQLKDYDTLILKMSNETVGSMNLAAPIIRNEINIRTYDIILINKEIKDNRLLLISCKKLPGAQEKLSDYSDKLGIPKIDLIKMTWAKYHRKRGGRR